MWGIISSNNSLKQDWIKNKAALGLTPLRRDALAILEAGLDAIDTETVIREEVRWDVAARTLGVKEITVNFAAYRRVYLVAFGKCAARAAGALENIFGDALTGGIVLDIQAGAFKKLISRVGTHPLPSAANIQATEEIIKLLEDLTAKDLVLVVVSGGGSALLFSPGQNDCATIVRVTQALTNAGATIAELNTVRKHTSRAPGGQLAKIAYPATVLGLVFSDVVGNDLSVIASGPLTRDQTTVAEARAILEKYNIFSLEKLSQFVITETPKDEKYFAQVKTVIIADNLRALTAMKSAAEKLNYPATIETTTLTGLAPVIGAALAAALRPARSAFLYGGETTVEVISNAGQGGRNQELALAALPQVKDKTVLMACASDGRDNSAAAGAIADVLSRQNAREKNLDPSEYLRTNNSYPFWQRCGGQIITGPTGANVADLLLILTD